MFGLMMLFYLAMVAYVYVRGWFVVFKRLPHSNKWWYMLACALLFGVFMLFQMGQGPFWLRRIMGFVGGAWFAFMLYAMVCTVLVDIAGLVNRLVHIVRMTPKLALRVGLGIISLCLLIVCIGTFNARSTKIEPYEVSLRGTQAREVTIAMVSDIHLSEIITLTDVRRMVRMTNELNADLIVIAGDIFNQTRTNLEQWDELKAEFAKLHAPLGVVAVTGNHDGYGDAKMLDLFFEGTGIHVMHDEVKTIDGAFTLIGRNDSTNESRVDLVALTAQADPALPLIVIDHKPNMEEAMAQKVGLQLSGHTHNGQLFPLNLNGPMLPFKSMIFPIAYGLEQHEETTFIVSSGFGAWASAVRIGSRSEILRIKVTIHP